MHHGRPQGRGKNGLLPPPQKKEEKSMFFEFFREKVYLWCFLGKYNFFAMTGKKDCGRP